MSYQTTPDEPVEYIGSDGNWKDGDVPHYCGHYIEDHPLVNGRYKCPPPPEEEIDP